MHEGAGHGAGCGPAANGSTRTTTFGSVGQLDEVIELLRPCLGVADSRGGAPPRRARPQAGVPPAAGGRAVPAAEAAPATGALAFLVAQSPVETVERRRVLPGLQDAGNQRLVVARGAGRRRIPGRRTARTSRGPRRRTRATSPSPSSPPASAVHRPVSSAVAPYSSHIALTSSTRTEPSPLSIRHIFCRLYSSASAAASRVTPASVRTGAAAGRVAGAARSIPCPRPPGHSLIPSRNTASPGHVTAIGGSKESQYLWEEFGCGTLLRCCAPSQDDHRPWCRTADRSCGGRAGWPVRAGRADGPPLPVHEGEAGSR